MLTKEKKETSQSEVFPEEEMVHEKFYTRTMLSSIAVTRRSINGCKVELTWGKEGEAETEAQITLGMLPACIRASCPTVKSKGATRALGGAMTEIQRWQFDFRERSIHKWSNNLFTPHASCSRYWMLNNYCQFTIQKI